MNQPHIDTARTTEHDRALRFCCVCGVALDDWTRENRETAHPDTMVSHGYCPPCLKAALDALQVRRKS